MRSRYTGLVAGFMMLLASLLGMILSPERMTASTQSAAIIDQIVPTKFGDWEQIGERSSEIVDPEQKRTLERIYTKTLSHSFRNLVSGQIVMLSIAFGESQTKQDQVHRPEVCYPAQGFSISDTQKTVIQLPSAQIPVRRLVATTTGRIEPITYWIRVGDRLAAGWMDQKIAVVAEGLKGHVADGLLFRVSSIDSDIGNAFAAQEAFIRDFLAVVPEAKRPFLLGNS